MRILNIILTIVVSTSISSSLPLHPFKDSIELVVTPQDFRDAADYVLWKVPEVKENFKTTIKQKILNRLLTQEIQETNPNLDIYTEYINNPDNLYTHNNLKLEFDKSDQFQSYPRQPDFGVQYPQEVSQVVSQHPPAPAPAPVPVPPPPSPPLPFRGSIHHKPSPRPSLAPLTPPSPPAFAGSIPRGPCPSPPPRAPPLPNSFSPDPPSVPPPLVTPPSQAPVPIPTPTPPSLPRANASPVNIREKLNSKISINPARSVEIDIMKPNGLVNSILRGPSVTENKMVQIIANKEFSDSDSDSEFDEHELQNIGYSNPSRIKNNKQDLGEKYYVEIEEESDDDDKDSFYDDDD